MNPVARAVWAAWWALSCVAGYAAEAERASAPPIAGTPSRQLIDQKEALVARLLGDSPAASRIAKSGNLEAQQFVEKAREQYARARAALETRDLGAADVALNDAIWMIGKARQLVPDTMYRVIEQRFRYAQLIATLDSLQESYRRHLSRLGRAERDDPGWDTVSRLIERGRSLRASEQLGDANLALLQAEQRLLASFGYVLSGTTIDYTPRFSNESEEFQFELERNRNYRDLVPLALAELSPSSDAVKLVERYMESNRSLAGRARQLAEKKNYAEALSTLRAGTAFLQRALLAAGLVVQQEIRDRETEGGR